MTCPLHPDVPPPLCPKLQVPVPMGAVVFVFFVFVFVFVVFLFLKVAGFNFVSYTQNMLRYCVIGERCFFIAIN